MSDEALLQILTHVTTTACETIEIKSCEEAMRFLKAWGKASLTSPRHVRGIKTLKGRVGPLQAAMEREAYRVLWRLQPYIEVLVPGDCISIPVDHDRISLRPRVLEP